MRLVLPRLRPNPYKPRRFASRLIWIALLSATLAGCGKRSSDVPVGDAAENIRKLALAYVRYASEYGGLGPPDRAAFAKAVVASAGDTDAEASARFTSIRDNKPYVILWKQRPMGPAINHNPPQPTLIIYEQDGLDGKRYTADGRMSIKEMSDEQIRQTYPDYEKPGG